MQLPPLDKGLLAKMGIAPDAVPIIPAPADTFSINIKKPQPQTQKALTSDECVKLFGAREAVLMNFIPQMLTALALEQAEAFIDYCRHHRLSEYKRHNQQMQKCIFEYNYGLHKSYNQAWQAYQNYYARLHESVSGDLFRCWCAFTNEASRQYIGHPHKEIPARLAFVKMLLDFVEKFDKETDKIIARRINKPCRRIQDPFITLITILCVDMADVFGQSLEITQNMSMCVKILANRCRKVVDDIIIDEDTIETKKY